MQFINIYIHIYTIDNYTCLSIGPICSACVVNFGARPVTIFSGVMISGGLMLSAFAPNVHFLMFSYGIVVGRSCVYVCRGNPSPHGSKIGSVY